MSEIDHYALLDQLARERAEEARRKVAAYVLGELHHENPGGMTGDDEINEGKN